MGGLSWNKFPRDYYDYYANPDSDETNKELLKIHISNSSLSAITFMFVTTLYLLQQLFITRTVV